MPRPTRLADLPARALRLAELLPLARLHPAVLATVSGARARGPWCVAFSGGADSLALLLLLWAHWPERRRQLVALHFNHRLRGRAAAADARFCLQVCAALGIRGRVGEWRDAPKAPSEAEARTARQAFFAREMKRRRARLLWLAHQQDDVAETLLMRLARGSGTAGLAAPRPVQARPGELRLRPLLMLAKRDLVTALRSAGISWREDATNATEAYFRNRVRQNVMPAWQRAAGRDVLGGVALSRERLEEDDAALEMWLEGLAAFDRRGRLLLAPLVDKPLALWRRALHRWLLRHRPDTDLSRQGFEQFLALVRRGADTRFSLGRSAFAVLRAGRLELRRV
ncbi:MAG: tRNA lysidine(34) synthetase TilS [Candidatus Didemnitutus sp.]|nr:tRNA lysidine(34) synthetase TilS [Candidatus Didemnitutus sp.]